MRVSDSNATMIVRLILCMSGRIRTSRMVDAEMHGHRESRC
jgi:hypothetical protein